MDADSGLLLLVDVDALLSAVDELENPICTRLRVFCAAAFNSRCRQAERY